MAKQYIYQARDSVTGLMHYWTSASATGGGYPGTNSPQEVTRLGDNGSIELFAQQYAFIDPGSHAWTVPANMVYADVVLVGGGQAGGDGISGKGGDGGAPGQIVQAVIPGPLAIAQSAGPWPTNWPLAAGTSVNIVVGAGGASNGATGGPSYIRLPVDGGRTILYAVGGGPHIAPPESDVVALSQLAAWQATRPTGGAGGTASSGSRGYHSGYGSGGNGGSGAGLNGTGYGAGGAGGRNNGGSNAGGGGGAGGYGWSFPDGLGGGSGFAGWPGVRGACFITAWLR